MTLVAPSDARPGPGCRVLGRCQRLESVVINPRDEQQVYEPDDPGLAKPSQLSEDLPGERRLVETEDQNLDWA